MTDLEQARAIISEADREMAKVFEKRMAAVRTVAAYKKANGLPITDRSREEEMLREEAGLIEDESLRPFYVSFLRETIGISKSYQHRLMDGMRVAYSGVEGAFANIAAEKIFPDATCVAHADFAAAYRAVEEGTCDCAVLPIENSQNGDVGRVLDLAYFGKLYVSGVYEVEIVHNLLAVKGTTMDEVRTVVSHEQALGQCANYLESHGFATAEAVNTAVAAKTVAEAGRHDLVAIGSAEAAAKFGLKVLESHINDNSNNTTRFAVFTREKREANPEDGRFLMLFSVNNAAGSLGRAINVIGEHGFNLLALKSRPRKDLAWEYYFYAESEGNVASEAGQAMLADLRECCTDLKVLGSYEREVRL